MRLCLSLLIFAARAFAHVGSPDVFLEGNAGPYRLMVTVRPPAVIPGVAEVEVRSSTPGVETVRVVPLPIQGAAAKFAPTPDVAVRSKSDPQFFTGSLWMMAVGSWQVRVEADGSQGRGELSVPVPALPQRTKTMQAALGFGLFAMLLVLGVGLVSIVGAGVREGALDPGAVAPPSRIGRARRAMVIAAVAVAAIVWLGNRWWSAEAAGYERRVYKGLQMQVSVDDGKLRLRLHDPGWLNRRVDDLVSDHGHLMHLFVVRVPEMDRMWHLHPDESCAGAFEQRLPVIPAGHYEFFGDIVHQNGLGETAVATFDLPDINGAPLEGDDSGAKAPPVGGAKRAVCQLEDGTRLTWLAPSGKLQARTGYEFRFRVDDGSGAPAKDLEPYMGMPAHAAFLRSDRSVFAHVHPSGSVPMAALQMVQPGDPHAAHAIHGMHMSLPAEVSFPYGFPQPGDYRIFVQVKRAGRVETAFFDTTVEK